MERIGATLSNSSTCVEWDMRDGYSHADKGAHATRPRLHLGVNSHPGAANRHQRSG